MRPHTPFVSGLVVTGLLLLVLLFCGLADWGGASAEDSTNPYCETVDRDALIRQPINTWSNLGPILAGLAILLHLAWADNRRASNPMQQRGFFTTLYGLLVIWLGPGSMFFHASMKEWGGWLDNLSMNMYVLFPIAYDLVRMLGRGKKTFLGIYLPSVFTLALLGAVVDWEHFGKLVFGLLILVAVGLEVWVMLDDRLDRQWRWFFAGMGVFGVAFLIWILSATDAPLCEPDGLFQGHAVWHVLAAVATVFFYVYFRSETRRTP